MGEYFIGSDGELYHWQLKNHKYIKREKKNGKWVYTYPEENKTGKTPVTKKKTDPVTSGKTSANRAAAGVRNVDKLMSQKFARRINQARDVLTNDFGNYKPISGESLSKSTSQKSESDKRKAETKKVSSEYEAELAYNSKKNDYGDAAKKNSETKKQEEKKERTWLEKAKEKLDNLGDSIEDIVDNAGDVIDDAKDWIGDRADDLYDATIGEIKDVMGYDERDALAKASDKRDRNMGYVTDMLDQLTESLHDKRNTQERKIEMSEYIADGFLQPRVEDYLNSDVEYRRAEEAYYSTPLGKLDSWLNDRDTSTFKPGDSEAIQARMSTDPTLRKAEVDLVTNELTYMLVRNYLTPPDSPWIRDDEKVLRDYCKKLESASDELYSKLNRYAHNGMDLRRNDNSNMELDRVDRIFEELEELVNRRYNK